jgi:hypothetical protein
VKIRATYLSRQDLRIASESECIIYGPESAKAYATIKRRHDAIMTERQQAKQELAPIRELLRKHGSSLREANMTLHAAFPESWPKLYPWRRLSREGFHTVRWAARLDTIAIDNGAEFSVFDSPRDAYNYYYGKGVA